MHTIRISLTCALFFLAANVGIINVGQAQKKLDTQDLVSHTIYFKMPTLHTFDATTQQHLLKAIGDNQFVGLAELHRSQKLSHFTTAFLQLLKTKGFKNFALELGPFSAQTLTEASKVPEKTLENIQKLNNQYRIYRSSPLVFADRIADAAFIKEASTLGFQLWGLDQEFIYSYEMHLDALYKLLTNKNQQAQNLYKNLKTKVRKGAKKSARSRKYAYNCTLQQSEDLQKFFALFKGNKAAEARIKAMKISWEIYCREEQRKRGSQLRANYMKHNFDSMYTLAAQKETMPKVFVKMGSVHLTRGISPYRIHDAGEHLTAKAKKNNTGFITFRHLRRFRNGKDLITHKGWQSVKLLISVGKKDQWTLTDLRPLRDKIKNGLLVTDKRTKFEIFSYDFMLIPPNDHKARRNF
ncbi:MAG TPA: hypothetical protein DCS93_01640 [Microscillaceae bacterium]|nr:hypothetical protein [Microscillaceae bacterium]